MDVTTPAEEQSLTFVYTFRQFSRLGRRVHSDTYTYGGYDWRLLLFPMGNNGPNDLSLFLEVANAKDLPPDWSRSAQFQLTVINQRDEQQSVSKDVYHRFSNSTTDWGFSQFMKLNDLTDESKGFLDNDKLKIRCNVELRDVIPIANYSSNYDSKKETGYVGLRNQGATCYMNSLLQTLFHTTGFRKAVYLMPTLDKGATGIPLALQRVFFRLQTCNTSVGTKELTKSFGWDAHDSFTQHDVQELNRVLCDNLEEKMKNTAVDGEIARLFEGKVENYVECVNVDFKSKRVESFYDLSLNVKGCKDIYESFDKYVEVEMLDKDNKYHADGHGLQDARKGVKFVKFPPVLHLQLKRFEYEPMKETMVKVNDRYQFYQQIDLDKYLAEDADRAISNTYELHSVLVHSGDVSGGHYYAFIKPTKDPQWYKFDDERVSKASEDSAISDNFGGGGEETPAKGYQRGTKMTPFSYKSFSNAYMLVYVRVRDFDDVMRPLTESDIPEHLIKRFEEERLEEEARKKERAEAHLYSTLKIATEQDFAKHIGTDLVNFDSLTPIRFPKAESIRSLKRLLQEKSGIPVSQQRLWAFETRQNKTIRPDSPLTPRNEEQTVQAFMLERKIKIDEPRFFLQAVKASISPKSPLRLRHTNPDDSTSVCPPLESDDVILFFKFYDPYTPSLEYVGHHIFKNLSMISSVVPVMNRLKGWPENTPLLIYEEVRPNMIEAIVGDHTIRDGELNSGDILSFQKAPAPPPDRVPYADITDYYEYLHFRTTVRFFSHHRPKELDFTLELTKNMSHNQVAAKVAEKVGTDPLKIRFWQTNHYNQTPKSTAWKRTDARLNLNDMLTQYGSASDYLFYEKLDYDVTELETNVVVKVNWFNAKVEEVAQLKFLVPMNGTVANVLQEVKTRVKLEQTGQIRLWEVWYHRLGKLLSPNDLITSTSDTVPIRAEEISAEELEAAENPNAKTIVACHVVKDSSVAANFGEPFFFVVYAGEPLSKSRSRIQAKLGLSDEEFAKWKLLYVLYSTPEPIKEDEILFNRFTGKNDYLGLEHTDSNRTVYKSYADRPVKIYH